MLYRLLSRATTEFQLKTKLVPSVICSQPSVPPWYKAQSMHVNASGDPAKSKDSGKGGGKFPVAAGRPQLRKLLMRRSSRYIKRRHLTPKAVSDIKEGAQRCWTYIESWASNPGGKYSLGVM
ncbi:hypothetical protein D9756_010190 [Leucocoprinus leucothites]|uniref:Uncharacterized protein n=1 Tax=Leucocoprinus leucothites TaxID=201217 RepID=A0A8H5FSU9_9AGAR|nr:hypothetical protein D9756_010190 [Leucoagaricus leucothites]